jgi:hypothetical protein
MATEQKFHTIHDIATGETIVREYTTEEYAQDAADSIAAAALEAERVAEEEATAAAKASAVAKLEAVGLTADEIAALTK